MTHSIALPAIVEAGHVCSRPMPDAVENNQDWLVRPFGKGRQPRLYQLTCPNGHHTYCRVGALQERGLSCYECGDPTRTHRLSQALANAGLLFLGVQREEEGPLVRYRCDYGHEGVMALFTAQQAPSQCSECRGLKRLQFMKEKIEARGWECLSTEPILDTAQVILYRCSCGKTHRRKYLTARAGLGRCDSCRTQHIVRRVAKIAKEKGGDCLSKEGVCSVVDPIRMRCKEGHVWDAMAFNIISGHWCKQCHFDNRKIDLKTAEALAAANNGRLLSSDIQGSQTKLHWECEYGHRFKRPYTQFRLVRKFCPRCKDTPPVVWPAGTEKKSESDRLSAMRANCRAAAAKRGGQCADHEYRTAQTKITWTCKAGHEWRATPGNVVYNGSWCPTCESLARPGAKLVTVVSEALAQSGEG